MKLRSSLFYIKLFGVVFLVSIPEEGPRYYLSVMTEWFKRQYIPFQTHKPTVVDYSIIITPQNTIDYVDERSITYLPFANWHTEKNSVEVPFHISQAQFELIIKKILFEKMSSNYFFIHGSAVADSQGGAIFLGKSGAGKSTISKQLSCSKNMRKISDDIIGIRIIHDTFFLTQTPFIETHWEYIRSDAEVPLTAIYLLKKADTFSISKPLSAARTFELLIEQSIMMTKSVEKSSLGRIKSLANKIPINILSFSLDTRSTLAGYRKARQQL
jgi:hypothetical protein